MISIDFVGIITLMPVRDFPNTSEEMKRTHKHLNLFFLILFAFCEVLLALFRWKNPLSLDNMCKWAGGAMMTLCAAWVGGFVIQICQCLDINNQGKPGRDKTPDNVKVFSDCFESTGDFNSFIDVCKKYVGEKRCIYAWECRQAFDYLQVNEVVKPDIASFTLFGDLFNLSYPGIYKVKSSRSTHRHKKTGPFVTRLKEVFPPSNNSE